MNTIRSMQYDTIDRICWRYYGRGSGVIEQVIAANPQLADIGVILPIGTLVNLPEISTPQATKQSIQLWD